MPISFVEVKLWVYMYTYGRPICTCMHRVYKNMMYVLYMYVYSEGLHCTHLLLCEQLVTNVSNVLATGYACHFEQTCPHKNVP